MKKKVLVKCDDVAERDFVERALQQLVDVAFTVRAEADENQGAAVAALFGHKGNDARRSVFAFAPTSGPDGADLGAVRARETALLSLLSADPAGTTDELMDTLFADKSFVVRVNDPAR